jgi:O-antigen/teichoic acid export membrane protein
MKRQSLTETQKFTSDVIWLAVCDLLTSLLGFVTLPALTKHYPSEVYGLWVQIAVTVALLYPILTLRFETSIVRFLAADEDVDRRRCALSAMLWPTLALAGLVLVVSVVLRRNLSSFLFASPQYGSLVPLAFLWAVMAALFSLSLAYLRARGKIKSLATIQAALATAKMAAIVALAGTGHSLDWVVAFVVIAQAAFVATVFGMITEEIGFPKPTFQGIHQYLALSIPMIPSVALMWVINSSDRYFIVHLLSLSQAAVYSASYTLGGLVSLLYTPITFALFPTIASLWERKEPSRVKNYLEYSTRLFLGLAVPATAGLYILSQPLLAILTTSEYVVGGSLVLLIAVGTILLGIYQMNVYIIVLVRQTKWLPLMIAVAAATNAGINLALIPRVGIMGAAISSIVSYLVLAAIVTLWARKAVAYRLDLGLTGKVVLATAIMGICLRFIPAGGASSLAIAVIAGSAVYGLALFLLKALSKEDRRLIREALSGVNPRLWRGEFASRQNAASTVGKGPEDEDEKEHR